MEFQKTLLHTNQHQIDSDLATFETPRIYFQNIVNRIVELGINVENNDLQKIVENPKAYIVEKITSGQKLEVGGLMLNKEKLFELIEKPIGTDELIDSIETDKQKVNVIIDYLNFVQFYSVSDGFVVISPEHSDFLVKRNSLYIESQNQKNGFDLMKKLVALVNEINSIAVHKIASTTEISELMQYNGRNYNAVFECVKRF